MPAPTSIDLEEGPSKPLVEQILKATGDQDGYVAVWGLTDGRLVEELARQSRMTVIAVDPDEARIERLRRRWDEAGLYGTRVAAWVGQPQRFG